MLLRPFVLVALLVGALASPTSRFVAHAQPVVAPASPLAPLDLPAPNDVRAATAPRRGLLAEPQRLPDHGRLRHDAHDVTGTVPLTYTNHSPARWCTLASARAEPVRPGQPGRGAHADAGRAGTGAFGRAATTSAAGAVQNGLAYAPRSSWTTRGCAWTSTPPSPPHGGQIIVTVHYTFVSPEYGADRMGRFEAAPRDGLRVRPVVPPRGRLRRRNGWNALPYLGQGEFYLEYGDFDVELTRPATMTVVATGALQNEAEVWTAEQRARLARARPASAPP